MSVFVYDYNVPTTEHLERTHQKMFVEVRKTHPDIPIIIMPRPKYSLNDDEAVRFEIIKKSYYGSQIRGFNNVESVATLMINSYMSDVIPFDTVEIVAEITLEDIHKRLFSQFNTENYTISIINPIK